jgi:DNA-binding transcriptional regulator YhcF (GntR family)
MSHIALARLWNQHQSLRYKDGRLVSPGARLILAYIADKTHRNGEFFHSRRVIAAATGLHENSVERALRRLIDAGLVIVKRRYAPSGRNKTRQLELAGPLAFKAVRKDCKPLTVEQRALAAQALAQALAQDTHRPSPPSERIVKLVNALPPITEHNGGDQIERNGGDLLDEHHKSLNCPAGSRTLLPPGVNSQMCDASSSTSPLSEPDSAPDQPLDWPATLAFWDTHCKLGTAVLHDSTVGDKAKLSYAWREWQKLNPAKVMLAMQNFALYHNAMATDPKYRPHLTSFLLNEVPLYGSPNYLPPKANDQWKEAFLAGGSQ